jgi:hypothetical protein
LPVAGVVSRNFFFSVSVQKIEDFLKGIKGAVGQFFFLASKALAQPGRSELNVGDPEQC